MEKIPIELIENILISPILSIKDIVRFSSTCHHFRNLLNENTRIWKRKYFHLWPKAKKYFDGDEINYFNEFKYIYVLNKRAIMLLETMSPKFYKRYELSDYDLQEWNSLLHERKLNYPYLVAFLTDLVNSSAPPISTVDTIPFNTPGHKTLQYYAYKALRFIRQQYLSKEWKDFISLPPKRQVLEIGAVFVAQWCQPNIDIDFDDISNQLDQLAQHVRNTLQTVYPDHSLFKVSNSQLALWKKENLEENMYNPTESRLLMSLIRQVLFQDLEFRGNNEEYYMPQNSFINEVLFKKQGLPITLAIVFEAVARRLGLRVDPISIPAHFLLRFCENYEDKSDWYYIDVFNGGQIVQKRTCPHVHKPRSEAYRMMVTPVATAAQVVERMANNLEVSARQHSLPSGRITRLRSSLELLKLVNPRDISALVSLARLYMLQNMDTKSLEQILLSQEFQIPEQAQRVVHMLRDYEAHHRHNDAQIQVEIAQRSSNLRYAVGMVMTHLHFDYKCVIYDWDLVCLAADEWQANNNVDKLANKDKQPFYNVLVEDGSHRYVAQENLKPTTKTGFLYLNDEVGRHFSHFHETHYVPNAEKELEYPADKEIRLRFHQQFKSECKDL